MRRICFLSMPANRTVRKKLMVTVPTDVSAHDIVETVRSSILVLSEDLHVISANRAFYTTFGVTPEETIGRFVYDLGNGYLRSEHLDRKSTRLNSSHSCAPRMTSYA